jgi:hypothetical protein
MYKSFVFALLVVAIASPAAVSAELSPFTPIVAFEMSGLHNLVINGESIDVSLLTFYESSQNWVLFLRHNPIDDPPFDSLLMIVGCNGESPVTFNTTEYSQWASKGVLSVEFPYQQSGYAAVFNSETLTGKFSECTLSVADYGAASYVNNSFNYTSFDVELIPFLATVDFVDCSEVDSGELTLLSQLSSMTGVMTDFWQILWLVFSMTAIILGVFMIPIFIFILIRWFVYRMVGIKIVERQSG